MKNKNIIIFLVMIIPLFFLIYLQTNSEIEVINNRDYSDALIFEINSADDSIYVSIFSLTYYDTYSDSSVNSILEALVAAKNRGVDVKVIVDEFPVDVDKGVDFLNTNNVSVKYDGKEQTTHSKLVIIDEKEVFVGSSNWRYYSLDKNNEANVLIKSRSIAKQYTEYFFNIWENGKNI